MRRKGDAGRLWEDEDSGESEGQEIRKSQRESDETDMVKDCIAEIPAEHRRRALTQMGYPDTFAEAVDEEAA